MKSKSLVPGKAGGHSQSAEHGNLRPVACSNCRQRRSFCSKDKPICSRCRHNGLTCMYEEARKILVNESYLRELERKAKALETALSQSVLVNVKGSDGGTDEEQDDFQEDQSLLEPFTNLNLHKPSTSFLGPASSDNFLRNLRELSGLYGDDGSLDSNPHFYDTNSIPSRRQFYRSQIRLPHIEMAKRLFAAYYTYIGTIFAFTDPQENFDKLLVSAYAGAPDPSNKDTCLGYAKVLLVLAFGQLYSVNQWVDFRGPPGFDYLMAALNLLPDTHEEGTIRCVETLALAGYFMQNMNRRDAAFQYIGQALRMAISLGLHHEISSNHNPHVENAEIVDEAMRERRRRVWWSVYSLDRILTVKSGNPISIQDEDIGVNLPSRLASEPEYCPAIVLGHYTKLSRILGEIHTLIYRKTRKDTPKSGKSLMASVQSIILKLSGWKREIPKELQFNPARLSISRESVSALAHYYQCINMTVRPLLFHVVQKRLRTIRTGADPGEKERDWKEGLSQTSVRVIDMCIAAAQDTVNIMVIASHKDLVATYGYMDGEHIFSASIVLVMVCAAFPTNAANTAAMNAGLGLLHGMGERGNSHMGARYELLAKLRSCVMPEAMYQEAPSTESYSGEGDFPSPTATVTGTTEMGTVRHTDQRHAQDSMSQLGELEQVGEAGETLTFPVVGSGLMDEPFFDETVTSGMDFALWEEGFAFPTMDLDLDWVQGQPLDGDTATYFTYESNET